MTNCKLEKFAGNVQETYDRIQEMGTLSYLSNSGETIAEALSKLEAVRKS